MNREEYERSIRRWSAIFASVVGEAKRHDWEPWLNTSYENYAQGDDEIVIFSRYASAIGKGFSIQQQIQMTSDAPTMKAVTRTALAESEKPITHLVICCRLDEACEPLIRELLRIWCLSDARTIDCEIA